MHSRLLKNSYSDCAAAGRGILRQLGELEILRRSLICGVRFELSVRVNFKLCGSAALSKIFCSGQKEARKKTALETRAPKVPL